MICDYCKKDCTAADPVWIAPDLCAECGRNKIDMLQRALVDAIDLAAEGWSYAPDYFRDKWGADERLEELRAVMPAPSVTEEEPK